MRRKLSTAICSVAVAAALLVPATPANAVVTCVAHFQPGITVTVAGVPVRIPAVDVSVCVDRALAGEYLPTPNVVTGPVVGGPNCQTNCYAIWFSTGSASHPNTTVTVRVELDGTGVNRTVTVPLPGGLNSFCVFGVGFPDPPVGNCLISIDPDN